jgi:SAM-dependent methyltransferase
MSQEQRSQPSVPTGGDEIYGIDREMQEAYTGTRTAAEWVPFFLPHLRPGMSLLDCGCGVGSITLDLAERVVPGQVVGVDIDAGQLEVARAAAARRGVGNAHFEVASIHDLPFPEASFDAVFAHTLLLHLRDPLHALRQLRRMLKPGGIACVSDDDYGTVVYAPADPAQERFWALMMRVGEHNGASPHYSRHLRRLMLEAGFVRSEGHAIATDHYGTLDATRRYSWQCERLMGNPVVRALILAEGWADEAELAQLHAAILAWGERPDAFFSLTYFAAVGWVGGEPPRAADSSEA